MENILSGLTMRMMITASGLEATPVTRVTVCQLTTDTSSPQWTETMTSPLNVALALLLTVEDGGSTGENLKTLVCGPCYYFRFPAALNQI